MSRPSFQFYPDDWRANSNLRRCSWAARGAWVDVICLMHDSDRYGALAWTLKEIAQALGCPMALLNELVAKGVLKGCDKGECEEFVYTPRSGRKNGPPVVLIPAQEGPFWFSSRMVRDEYLRTIRGEGSRFGAGKGDAPNQTPKAAPKQSPKPPMGEGQSDGSTSSSPSSTRIANAIPPHSPPKRGAASLEGFDRFWALYPRKVGKGAAEKAWPRAVAAAEDDPNVIVGGLNAALSLDRFDLREAMRFVPHPATWLNEKRWLDGVEPEPPAPDPQPALFGAPA